MRRSNEHLQELNEEAVLSLERILKARLFACLPLACLVVSSLESLEDPNGGGIHKQPP